MSEIVETCVTGANSLGRAFCGHAIGVSIQAGVLILVLLCIDLLLRKRVRATLRYWIWMLVFVKLLLPPSLSVPTGIGYWLGRYAPAVAMIPPQVMETTREPVYTQPAAPAEMPLLPPSSPAPAALESIASAERVTTDSEPLTWQGGIFLLWGAGALVFAGLVVQRLFFVRGLIAQAVPARDGPLDLLDECRRRMGVRGEVGLRLSPHTFSPAVCGLLRPTIVIPAGLMERLSPENLRAVLIHEMAHVKRGDLWINSLQTVLQIVYFYNPLVWLANAIVRRVREQAVDEMVLVALGAEARSYSTTLIEIAEMAFLRVSPALRLVGVAESRKSLEGRIRHMVTRPIPKSAKVGVIGVFVVVAIGAILLPLATAQTETAEPKFAATLSNGVTVELVGICNWATGEPICWKPDGTPFDMPMRARDWNRSRAADDYGFLLRVAGTNDFALTWAIEEAQGSSGSADIVDAQGNRLEGFKAITASMAEAPKQTTVRVGLATGPWRTMWTHDGKAGGAEGGDTGGILWSQAFEDSDGIRIVASTRGGNDADRRIVAFDANGKVCAASSTDASSVTNIWQLTATFPDLKRDEIKEFQFQVRPYEWARFEHVSLIRGAKTEVDVWIKSVPQPSGQETIQTTADGPSAKLPEDQRSLDQTLQMAEDLRRAQEFESARRAYQSIMQEWPDTEQAASARMGLVDLELASLIQAGDQTVAQQAIERVMAEFSANPYLPRTLDRVGDQYARIRQYETAESFYRKVIGMAADDERAADAQSAIGWIYFERGLYEEAMREYSKVVQDYPATSSAARGQYWLAQCLFRKGEFDRAREEFEKTVKMYPEDKYAGHARTQMALIERRRENDARRAAAWGMARASAGNPSADTGAEPLQRTQLARPTLLHGIPWETRISEILGRLHTATEKAHRDVGLSGQDLETIYRLQMPPQELVAKYRASWPAILEARNTAKDELASLGADSVPYLLKTRDQSSDRRGGDLFVDAIVKVGEKAVPAAIEGLFDVDPMVRIRAVLSLGRLGDPRAVEPLLRVLANSDSTLRRDVVMALGALKDRRAVDSLLNLWSEQGRTDGGALAWALATSGDVRAVAPIMAALQECLAQAKETGDWDREGPLMSSYAGALGRLGDARAVSLLEEALRAGPQSPKGGAPVFLVGEAAAQALRRLGCKVVGDKENGGYRVVSRPVPGVPGTSGRTIVPPGQAGLRPEAFDGERSGGLQSVLVLATREIEAGKPVIAELWLENVSDKAITYYDFRTGLDETSVITVLVDGKPVRGYTTLDTTGRASARVGVMSNVPPVNPLVVKLPPVPREAFVTLDPGERIACLRKFDLGTVEFRSETRKGVPGPLRTPGEHTIQIEYRNERSGGQFGLNAWTGTLASRPISIRIIGSDESQTSAVPHSQASSQNRDYGTARTVPQSMERWRVQDYGCGWSRRTWQALQGDTKRRYPITLVWPLIQEAGKYVVTVKGLRGSRPAKSYEMTTNSLRLECTDIEPGRYQWSVSVHDAEGQFLGEVETIDPVEVFAVEGSEPAGQNDKKVLIDLNHSAGSIAGWAVDNHGQYMTKELLEQAGFAVEVNSRDLLSSERLRSVDLLICHYYWAGWPGFRPFSRSELEAVRRFVEEGGSLLVVGCDRTDGGGQMIPAGNELVREFGFLFKLDKGTAQVGWAEVVRDQDILGVAGRIQVQLPVVVEGEDSLALLQFQGVPIVRAKHFGKGRIIVAGVGMSFLDGYLGDYEHREPLHAVMFYDFVKYLTGVDCGQPEALLLR